jgi:serine/threonine protein kinase
MAAFTGSPSSLSSSPLMEECSCTKFSDLILHSQNIYNQVFVGKATVSYRFPGTTSNEKHEQQEIVIKVPLSATLACRKSSGNDNNNTTTHSNNNDSNELTPFQLFAQNSARIRREYYYNSHQLELLKYLESRSIAGVQRGLQMLRGTQITEDLRQALNLHPATNSLLICRYSRGKSLDEILKERNKNNSDNINSRGNSPSKELDEVGLSWADFFTICIPVAQILGEIHSAGSTHFDVFPGNILYDAASNEVTLIDFGLPSAPAEQTAAHPIASVQSQQNKPSSLLNVLAQPTGTDSTSSCSSSYSSASSSSPPISLVFISPEQTGRMNRSVDYRTDLYSFGVVMYYAITGRSPFHNEIADHRTHNHRSTKDEFSLVHSILAVTPAPPSTYRPSIPPALDRLIMKAMEKDPDRRYQSALGLSLDLQQIEREMKLCEKEGRDSFQSIDFSLAQADAPTKFIISHKLYGREQPFNVLHLALESCAQKAFSPLWITVIGQAGMGE